MKIHAARNEVEDIALTVVRSGTVRHGIQFHEPTELAGDWMRMDEGAWTWRNRNILTAEDMPTALLEETGQPFSSGECNFQAVKDRATIHLKPAWTSPGTERTFHGTATPMTGFGPGGDHRFTALHELAHWMAFEADLDRRSANRNPIDDIHRAEALADGFSVAWAVATGGEPRQCVADVGSYRACAAVRSFHAGYLTFDILGPAAEIGMHHRRSSSPDPRMILDQVHSAGARHLLPRGLIQDLHEKRWPEVKEMADAAPVVSQVRRYLAVQPIWTREDEDRWWGRLLAANPEHRGILMRAPATILVANAALPDSLEDTSRPYSAELLFKKLHLAAAAEGGDRAERLRALSPSGGSREEHAEAMRKAAGLFDADLDRRISHGLSALADHTLKCEKEPGPPVKLTLPRGIDAAMKPNILYDVRENATSFSNHEMLADRLRGQPVHNIAVVANTAMEARLVGEFLRAEGDMMRAELHPMDAGTYAERLPRIRSGIAKGQTLALGPLPECRDAPAPQR